MEKNTRAICKNNNKHVLTRLQRTRHVIFPLLVPKSSTSGYNCWAERDESVKLFKKLFKKTRFFCQRRESISLVQKVTKGDWKSSLSRGQVFLINIVEWWWKVDRSMIRRIGYNREWNKIFFSYANIFSPRTAMNLVNSIEESVLKL